MKQEKYLVLTPGSVEFKPNRFPIEDAAPDFRRVVEKEALKIGHEDQGEPEYLRLCQKYGIAWEPMSDVGHMRFGPKGALIFDLLADYAQEIVYDLGLPAFTIKGTNMFDLQEPAVSEHAELFGDRLYTIKDLDQRKEYVLRYAACHQQFAMIKDWQISYKHLPFAVLEIADSYRYEQSGEVMLCFRTRRLNMPDCHLFCRNLEEAKQWLKRVHERIYQEAYLLGRDYEMLINLSSARAYGENKELIQELLQSVDKPALIHFYPGGINYYWTVNIEYLIVDAMGHGREIATVQIDIGNARRFGIKFTDQAGQERCPVILHTAIIGTLERYLYLLFDTAVQKELEGKPGSLPLWVNPEQVRLLPTSSVHLHKAKQVATILERNNIRVGIDDRNESVSWKVRDARVDWVGYDTVIGDRELQGGPFRVFNRSLNQESEMALEELIDQIQIKTHQKPFRKLYFPRRVSERPNGI